MRGLACRRLGQLDTEGAAKKRKKRKKKKGLVPPLLQDSISLEVDSQRRKDFFLVGRTQDIRWQCLASS